MEETLDRHASGISTLAGSPKEVRRQLDKVKAEHVVAITLSHATPGEAAAISETIASVAEMVRSITAEQHQQALRTIVEALVPKIPPTPAELKEAAMLARARTAVIESGDWLTALQIAEIAGFSASNPSAQPNKWKRERAIFAIRHHGVDYFPSYALDPQAGYRPRRSMKDVLEVFEERKDAWGLAYWFMSVNGYLGGKSPRDLLATAPERVIAAAEKEVAGVLHG